MRFPLYEILKQKQWGELTDDLISIIKRDNPTFLSDFNQLIKSDDLYTVRNALDSASSIIQKAQYASTAYRNLFVVGEFMINDTVLKNNIMALDLTTEAGQQEFQNIINNNVDLKNELMACTPLYAICVVHSIAAVSATALGAVNVAAYATVVAKTAMFLWDKVKVFSKSSPYSSSYTVQDIFVTQVAESY